MAEARIERVAVGAYTVPTEAPESDGTIAWDSTTLVVVEVEAGGATGLGYTYASRAAAAVVAEKLVPVIEGGDAFAIPGHWDAMVRAVRNVGRTGIAACAISAVDVALWDLKARLIGVPLATLFGPRREECTIYGSGGFTSQRDEETIDQFTGWADEHGTTLMKMKVGRDADADAARIEAVADALPDIVLMIDANGALRPKQARYLADVGADAGVVWFEEPISSDDTAGLAALRPLLPPAMDLAAGEYAYDLYDVLRLLGHGCVDVLQLDATRCCGYSGFLAAAALADAHQIPVSAHTAPALHLPVCLAAPRLEHVEWFHDHARIEAMLFEGAPRPDDGAIAADLSRPGHGLAFRRSDAERYAAHA